ncbi:uncharacterized protein LOC128744148 isoform X2 [Sabethes cyaneus]|uniref:uncharacterized protein LOC128744148 isoform X2 n=1 Tax=Sabethes cyaneus TaxID=53552 RepID=UPI00237D928B|nr:uncharacterized protein LOC128744148 isoform X2 [Sabethes cyaneus]
MDTVSSSTDKSLQQNAAVRRRQMRQKVLNRIRKVNIKNKSSKNFYYFTYETATDETSKRSDLSSYFFNGEPCEVKRSVFVGNLAAGTRKSEIKELFDSYGRVVSVQLKTKNGKSIVGRQHISLYSPIVVILQYSKKEEATQVCEMKDGKFPAKLTECSLQYEKENCVRIDNVDPKLTKLELLEYFRRYGTVLNISLETNNGSLILTDIEYQQLACVCCYVRFSRRFEAKAAKEMNGLIFSNRKLRVELAYQKHCDPNKMSNNMLRMFFQSVGDVIALDQIPHQHMGYVCYKLPLPVETTKRLTQHIFRNKKIQFEKLDIGNIIKGQKQNKSINESEYTGIGNISNITENINKLIPSPSLMGASGSATKKTKERTVPKKVGNAGGGKLKSSSMVKKKLPRKNAPTSKLKSANEKNVFAQETL